MLHRMINMNVIGFLLLLQIRYSTASQSECHTTLSSCFYNFNNASFGDPFANLQQANFPYSDLSSEDRNQLCNAVNWINYDSCFSHCPTRLVITEPKHLAMTICIEENNFTPYLSDSHLSLDHPFNGKVLEFIAPVSVNNSLKGCSVYDFREGKDLVTSEYRNLTGKAVVVMSGMCYPHVKFQNAKFLGASAGIMINSLYENSLHKQLDPMLGSSLSLDNFLSFSGPNHAGNILFEELGKGTKVFGKFELSCSPLPQKTLDNYIWDSCPDTRLNRLCGFPEQLEDRLCQKCPLLAKFPGLSKKFCISGANLYPRRSNNYLQYHRTFPFTTVRNESIYLTNPAGDGCLKSDFEGMKGKIVFIDIPTQCLVYESVRIASQMGVAAYILMHDKAVSFTAVQVEGYSAFVDMPVHTVSPFDYEEVVGAIRDFGTTTDGGYHLGAIKFSEGSFPPRWEEEEPTPAPTIEERLTVELDGNWSWSVSMCVCVAIGAVLLIILGFLLHSQRKNSIELPAEKGETHFTLPLGVASMGLSLTLLMIIAIVAFILAHNAGQDSTNTAVDGGKAAAERSYQNALDNVGKISQKLREAVLNKIHDGLDKAILEGETNVDLTHSLFLSYNGTWNDFDSIYRHFVNIAYSMSQRSWQVNVFTLQGFFISLNYKTDDRPTGEREDNLPHVSITDSGFSYGVNEMRYDDNTKTTKYVLTRALDEYRFYEMLGGSYGEPLSVVTNYADGYRMWYITKSTFPQLDDKIIQPISVFSPLITKDGTRQGTIEVKTKLTTFGDIVSSAIQGEPTLQNMTLLVFDAQDGSVIGTNAWENVKLTGQVRTNRYVQIRGMFTIYDIPPVEIKAFSNWFVQEYDGNIRGTVAGQMNQKKYWSKQDLTILRVAVENSTVVDIAGDKWEMEVRDGNCGRCVEYDTLLEKEVLKLDNGSLLYLYTNLSSTTPRVAQTQGHSPSGEWVSRDRRYQGITYFSDGRNCISNEFFVSFWEKVTTCLLRESFQDFSYTISIKVNPDENILDNKADQDTPRLFSDTLEGEANLRFYATGQLNINVLTHVCQTNPIKGGIPVGVWTTLTGVIDYTRQVCEVYVNGTLYSSSSIAAGFQPRYSGEPLYVGHGFKGKLDDITIYNISLSPSEVMSVYTTGELQREVADRDWLIDVSFVNKTSNRRSGVEWMVVGMLPYDDIYREVDNNNAKTVEELRIQEENTQTKLRQNTADTIFIIVVIALASVLVFLVFNDMLTRPFASCAVLMAEAAILRIDEIPHSTSYIKELNAMNQATTLMLKNLKQFKSYMPQSLQLDDDTTDDDAEVVSAKDHSSIVSAARAGIRRDTQNSGSASEYSKAQAAIAQQKLQGALISLMRKKITLSVVNIRDWHNRIRDESDIDVIALHTGILSSILGMFISSKGVSEVFSGDRFVCTYNAAKPLGTHRSVATSCALQIQHVVEKEFKLNISASVVSGEGRVGNLGNEVMKRFSLMTPVVTWAYALERYARYNDMNIIVDSHIYDDVSFILYRILGTIFFEKRSSTPIRIAQICGQKNANVAGEWMYELEDAEKLNPFKTWNTFANEIIAGNWEAAEELRNDVGESYSDDLYNKFVEALQQEEFNYDTIPYH